MNIYQKKCIKCGSMFDRSVFEGNYIKKCNICEPLKCSVCKLPYVSNDDDVLKHSCFRTYRQTCKCFNVKLNEIDLNKLIITNTRAKVIDIIRGKMEYDEKVESKWKIDKTNKVCYLTKNDINYQSIRFYPYMVKCVSIRRSMGIYNPNYYNKKVYPIIKILAMIIIKKIPPDLIREIMKNILFTGKLLIVQTTVSNYGSLPVSSKKEELWNWLREGRCKYILINTIDI